MPSKIQPVHTSKDSKFDLDMKRDSLLKIRAEFNGSVEDFSNSIDDE